MNCIGVIYAATTAAALISQVENDLKNGNDPSASLATLKPAIAQVCAFPLSPNSDARVHSNNILQVSKAIRAAAADAPGEKKAKLYNLADKVENAFPELEKLAQSAHKNKDQNSQKAFASLAAEVKIARYI